MINHEQQNFETLDAAIEAIQSQSTADGPPEDLVTSTVEALQDKETSIVRPDPADGRHQRREMMFRFAKYGSLGTAASIAIVVFGSMLFSGLTSQSAFAQVLQNVREATGAKYSLVQKLGERPALKCESSFSGDMVRTDVAGSFAFLANIRTREMLQLVPAQKLALRGKVDGAAQQQPFNFAAVMKEMTEDLGELVETEKRDGKELDIYKVSKVPDFIGRGELTDEDSFRIWVDRKTQLPVQIKIRMNVGPPGKTSTMEMDFTDFVWNPTFPPGHFDMTVPEGYTVQPAPKVN